MRNSAPSAASPRARSWRRDTPLATGLRAAPVVRPPDFSPRHASARSYRRSGMDTQLPPSMVIYRLASAHYVSQALYVAAHLGIADLLTDGSQTHDTLAAKTGTHAGALR